MRTCGTHEEVFHDAWELRHSGRLRYMFGRYYLRVNGRYRALPDEARDTVLSALRVGRRLLIRYAVAADGAITFSDVWDV